MPINKGSVLRNDLKEIIIESAMDSVEFSADKIMPTKKVSEKSGNVPVLPTGTGLKNLDVSRNNNGTFKRGIWVYDTDSYSTRQLGYEEPIDNTEAEELDFLDDEIVSAKICYSQMRVAREKRTADAILNTSVFTGTANTLVLSNEWDDASNCTPYADVTSMHSKLKAKCGVPRNQMTLIMNENVFRNVIRSDEVRSDLKYTTPIDRMGEGEKKSVLTQFLGIKDVIVVTSFYDSSKLGIKNATFTDMFSDEYMQACYLAPSIESWKVPGLARRPIYTKVRGGGDFWVETYFEKNKDATIVRVREYSGEYVNLRYGVLVSNVTT
jgi:hypothetical protein